MERDARIRKQFETMMQQLALTIVEAEYEMVSVIVAL